MKNFTIISKLGKRPLTISGEGAFSEVFKVKRISDQQTYALKKVSYLYLFQVKLGKLSEKER